MPLHWPAGVKISTLPVGVGVDSSLRLLAWGCRRSNPGGSRPSLHPPLFRAGGCALILYNFESKMQNRVSATPVYATTMLTVPGAVDTCLLPVSVCTILPCPVRHCRKKYSHSASWNACLGSYNGKITTLNCEYM